MSLRVTIESLAAGGDGVGRLEDGRVVFVPRSCAGDVLDVSLTEEKKSYTRAAIDVVVSAGTGRREPSCAHFAEARCGGCQWLHLEEDVQAAAKSQLVASALRNVTGEVVIEPMVSVAPPTHWRRRARFHWIRPKGSAAAVIGFAAPRSKRVTEPTGCVQLHPALESIRQLCVRHLAEHLHKRGEIDVIINSEGNALASVRGPHARRGLEALAREETVLGVKGRGRPIGLEAFEIDDGLPATVGGFAQASATGNHALLSLVARALGHVGTSGAALELFAGSGNLTRALSKVFDRVVAVERQEGPRIELENVEWLIAESAPALKTVAAAGERFELVLLDPPRTGAAECIDGIVLLKPSAIVYVSCDPATLARDLLRLQGGGYKLELVSPIDIMPQTSHVEVVAVLRRA